MLQCVAVCCGVLQCVAVCCSGLQCGVFSCSELQCVAVPCITHHSHKSFFSNFKEYFQISSSKVILHITYVVCCSVLQCVALYYSVLHVLQCLA